MMQDNLIPLTKICAHYDVEIAFVLSLNESELIEVTVTEECYFIPETELPLLEKYINFHYTLGINMEGIETIHYLLQRVGTLQNEVLELKNQVLFHELSK